MDEVIEKNGRREMSVEGVGEGEGDGWGCLERRCSRTTSKFRRDFGGEFRIGRYKPIGVRSLSGMIGRSHGFREAD